MPSAHLCTPVRLPTYCHRLLPRSLGAPTERFPGEQRASHRVPRARTQAGSPAEVASGTESQRLRGQPHRPKLATAQRMQRP